MYKCRFTILSSVDVPPNMHMFVGEEGTGRSISVQLTLGSIGHPSCQRTISAAASGVPSPIFVGSTVRKILSNCYSMLHEHFPNRNRSRLAWALLWHLLSSVSSRAWLSWPKKKMAWVQMPTKSRNTAGPPSERPVAATAAFGLSHLHDSPA